MEAASALKKLAEVQSSHELEVPKLSPSQRGVVSDDDFACTKRTIKPRETFPQRLMAILSDSSLSDVISWLPHGRSFAIIRPDALAERVLAKYLPDPRSSTKYASFTRKLNRWGFRQATRGPETGAFHHPLFLRGQPELCLDLVCQKSRNLQSKNTHQAQNRSTESYNYSSLPPKKRKVNKLKHAPSTSDDDTQVGATCTPTVSGDDQSISSSSTLSSTCPSPQPASTINFPVFYLPLTPIATHMIVNDSSLVASSLKAREEMEMLAVAKSMLFDSYIKALKGQ
jgi:hypothetical protein